MNGRDSGRCLLTFLCYHGITLTPPRWLQEGRKPHLLVLGSYLPDGGSGRFLLDKAVLACLRCTFALRLPPRAILPSAAMPHIYVLRACRCRERDGRTDGRVTAPRATARRASRSHSPPAGPLPAAHRGCLDGALHACLPLTLSSAAALSRCFCLAAGLPACLATFCAAPAATPPHTRYRVCWLPCAPRLTAWPHAPASPALFYRTTCTWTTAFASVSGFLACHLCWMAAADARWFVATIRRGGGGARELSCVHPVYALRHFHYWWRRRLLLQTTQNGVWWTRWMGTTV